MALAAFIILLAFSNLLLFLAHFPAFEAMLLEFRDRPNRFLAILSIGASKLSALDFHIPPFESLIGIADLAPIVTGYNPINALYAKIFLAGS
jgi:hypothetical protein